MSRGAAASVRTRRRSGGIISAFGLLVFLPASSFAQPIRNLQPDSGKDCAVCHLEWVDSFNQPRGIVLMDRPAKPQVAESDTCLGCHDGSVSDSRRAVWLEHSHRTGVTPSAHMKVPEQLPLENGKLACRTCHTAHVAGVGGTLRDAVFLRINNEEGQLCKACHTDKSQGPEAGTHPLGQLPWKLPEALAEAGSHAGRNGEQVVCQTCHTAHGSRADGLLIMGTESSELCLTCHQKMAPAMFVADGTHPHPQNPPLRTDAQRHAIKEMGTKVGTDGTLICLSCHKMHHGQSGRAMLADTLTNSQFCLRCHPDRSNMAGSDHDLRKTAAAERNKRGQTAGQSGPCGACHTFHSYARDATPSDGDPQGLCTTCHAEGKVAAKHTGQPFSHPSDIDPSHIPKDVRLTLYPSSRNPGRKTVACLSCHNPHEVSRPHFLRTTGDDLCASCHYQKVRLLAGPHDFTNNKDMVNAHGRPASEAGKCGFCHAVHNANGPAMWVATKNRLADPDALCAECHAQGGVARKHPLAKFSHPTGPAVKPTTRPAEMSLPLFTASAHQSADGFVSCASCHDLHAGNGPSNKMLRSASTTKLCVQCHPKEATVAGGLHDARKSAKPWPSGGKVDEDSLCTSCHQAHSNNPANERWAFPPPQGFTGDAVCEGCHKEQVWNSGEGPFAIGGVIHPQKVPAETARAHLAQGFPLKSGTPNGLPDLMTCRTCHNPHAGAEARHLLRIQPDAPASDLCLSCHEEPRYVVKSMHAPDLLDPARPASHACLPCHATHAVQGSARELLWSTKVDARGHGSTEKLCLGCHDGTSAKRPTMIEHPQTALRKLVSGQPPQVQARVAAADPITCATCHLAHGREVDVDPSLPPGIAKAQRSHAKPMLRPNVDREVCAICHGIDSARVYLYFHNPRKREAVQKLMGP